MSTTLFRRPARRAGPEMPAEEITLQEPPGVPEPKSSSWSMVLTYLPMALMSGSMMLMFTSSGAVRGPLTYIAGGVMVVAMIGMVAGQLLRAAADRKHQLGGQRRDYHRYLAQTRKQVREALGKQYRAVTWNHPDPRSLWSLVLSYRLWERRATHDDFGEVRVGLGTQRAAVTLIPPETKPVEDLEPLAAHALRRFLRAYATLPNAPIAVYLRGFARVQFDGDSAATRALVRAMLGQLAAFHQPADLRIALCLGEAEAPEWDWVKWLPHAQDPEQRDGAGPVRLIADNVTELERLLGGESFTDRPRFETGTPVTASEPFVVVVLDGVSVPAGHPFTGDGHRNAVVLDLSGSLPWKPHRHALHLRITRMRSVASLSTAPAGRSRPRCAARTGCRWPRRRPSPAPLRRSASARPPTPANRCPPTTRSPPCSASPTRAPSHRRSCVPNARRGSGCGCRSASRATALRSNWTSRSPPRAVWARTAW
ncbi:hypothetical protein GCM10009545_13100 [Saccharopolyspora thermophila]|uniref:Uncharacterized protein n=1 Tax=Saccharopolyspora thermophila TaxID=89367 RepID=A0ABN1C5W5_9PSEU